MSADPVILATQPTIVSVTVTQPAPINITFSTLQGPPGPQGPPGTGAPGPQGEPGPIGPSGGAKGDKGDPGDQGPQGLPGAEGAQGLPGVDGVMGATGLQGVKGDPGLKGDKGDPGATGPQGEQGVAGSAAAKGDPGATGAKGDKGDPGVQGVQGIKGEKGDPGVKGDTGGIGPQGIPGIQGVQGPIGPIGNTGAVGDRGPVGPQGDVGPAGGSAVSVTDGTHTVSNITGITIVGTTISGSGGAAVMRPLVDLGVWIAGLPLAAEKILSLTLARALTLPLDLVGSLATAGVAATADCAFSIQKNAIEIGTLTFAAAGTAGTFALAADTVFAPGDVLGIVAPAAQDATLADVSITLTGTR